MAATRIHRDPKKCDECGDCLDACPAGVPIDDVLRTRMYAVDYDDGELARSEYAMLGAAAAPCLACAAQPCRGACDHGLPVARLLASTHRLLGAGTQA